MTYTELGMPQSNFGPYPSYKGETNIYLYGVYLGPFVKAHTNRMFQLFSHKWTLSPHSLLFFLGDNSPILIQKIQ